jgi:hypothetical protein
MPALRKVGPMFPSRPRLLIQLVSITVFFIPHALSSGQTIGQGTVYPPKCDEPDLEIHFLPFNDPGHYFNLVVTGRNISGHTCSFDSDAFWPSLDETYSDDWEVSEGRRVPYPECNDCKYGFRDGRKWAPVPPVNPGDVVAETFRWKTRPPESGLACLNADSLSMPAGLLVAPSLLKNVCSEISMVRVDVTRSEESTPSQDRSGSGRQEPELQLTTSKSTYFSGERFSLHIARSKPENPIPNGDDACPTFYVWYRSSETGRSRTDEAEPRNFKGCSNNQYTAEPGDWDSGFDVTATTTEGEAGETEYQVFARTSSLSNSRYQFLSSNILRVRGVDSTKIERKWVRAKGIAADITLDKDTYQVGEDIPLHMAIANLDAKVPIYAVSPEWDGCWAFELEVLDSAGRQIPDKDRFQTFPWCEGHGFGPMAFKKGLVDPLERHLKSMGWLPNHAGTYIIVLRWHTETGPIELDNVTGVWQKITLSPYATVQAAATIHIVGQDGPPSR